MISSATIFPIKSLIYCAGAGSSKNDGGFHLIYYGERKIKVVDVLILDLVYLDPNCPCAWLTDVPNRVLRSGIARVTSFFQILPFTNHHAQQYLEDTLCDLLREKPVMQLQTD